MISTRIHSFSALFSILVLVGFLVGWVSYARNVEDQYINALAPLNLSQAIQGDALQAAAFRHKDLLPVYGSSEMVYGDPRFRALNFFANYPTSFEIFMVAKNGATSLAMAQEIASLGQDLRGKKIVISFTPSMFTTDRVNVEEYTANFSRLHAMELIYSPYLSYSLKQRAARRMIQYPKTIEQEALLRFGVAQLMNDSLLGHMLYIGAYPVAFADILVIQLQDHWEVLNYIWQHPKLSSTITRQTNSLNWTKLIAQAYVDQKLDTSNNPYGVVNSSWEKMTKELSSKKQSPVLADQTYILNLTKSQEWADFDILLQTLNELGAQPLIKSHPIDGTLYDLIGISAKARKIYYHKLSEEVSQYGFPLIDYRNYEMDKYFAYDLASHTGRVGWVIVDQTFDIFFHNTLYDSMKRWRPGQPVLPGGP